MKTTLRKGWVVWEDDRWRGQVNQESLPFATWYGAVKFAKGRKLNRIRAVSFRMGAEYQLVDIKRKA